MADANTTIPTFYGPISLEEFRSAYDAYQCVYFKSLGRRNDTNNQPTTGAATKKRKRKRSTRTSRHATSTTTTGTSTVWLKSIQDIFQSTSRLDQESWCIENDNCSTISSNNPHEFFSTQQQGYCSFIIQDETASTEFTDRIAPYPTLPLVPVDTTSTNRITTAVPYWIFLGRNTQVQSGSDTMKGRSEHTDDIQHDGTFHYQLSGTKRWIIRPTDELRKKLQHSCERTDFAQTCQSLTICLEESDLLVINTRLWWHRTELPLCSTESISYARDIYFDGNYNNNNDDDNVPPKEHMRNQEGAWAVGFIEKGTLLYTEDSDPNMMHTSNEPEANCELVELDNPLEHEGCQWAVVALRDIQESEFFILLDNRETSGMVQGGD
jgi:hypothetical protein